MGSRSSPTLDEVHCLRPLCSHTCCWEAERRIREGRPQMMKTVPPVRAPAKASEEAQFPAITVVRASEWLDAGSPSEDDFSEADTNTLISQVDLPKGAIRQENVQIPSCTLAKRTHLEPQRGNGTVKLSTVHLSPLSSYTSTSQSLKPKLMQALSSCHVLPRDSRHSATSPRLAVKELIIPLPSAETNKSDGNKVHRLVSVGHSLATAPDDQQALRSAQTSLHLRNNPRVIQPVTERIQQRRTQEQHHTSKYKLRTSQTADQNKAGIDGTDWESLKRQTLLWSRKTQLAESERPSS
ncbi:hypothetical protein D5F01_LYC08980 [Larimichthys crocea]|uniref:Uncharacterized protein n=2 Tax=Larimichthys crocea TaxID=215358 RepID=A0ACD3Q7P6_LARCR|nr:hypothetical protein D5F01_LYC08980 [Larimichthys crocea]TMS03133.1 hypothetical protein E3U43_000022 [Larimichthys crocea]